MAPGAYVVLCARHALALEAAQVQARAILRKMERARRWQELMQRREFGYVDLGGEG
jgi:hypothetical protein